MLKSLGVAAWWEDSGKRGIMARCTFNQFSVLPLEIFYDRSPA
ncbi:MAG: hypothetical protein QE279_07305 [Rhodoferax sp.]|nr:hypothetical protein [Rhodoferax sp.]